jgi:hypothetical protein
MDNLDQLLDRARAADPGERILLRDPIAEHGELAIDAMTDWLGDPRLAAFAVRVLERVGRDQSGRTAVVAVLQGVDRSYLPEHIARDVERTLAALAGDRAATRGRPSRRAGQPRSPGTPGVPGRGYWVMRTSPAERAYVWAEAQRGRLRQGWGWNEEMNLERIADIVTAGGELSDEQRMSWRSRRMLPTAHDGMRLEDLVVVPNLPSWGQVCVFRIVGAYRYELDAPRQYDERFGHVLPVELLASGIDRRSSVVSDGLAAMLRLQPRLFNILGYGGDVERLVGGRVSSSGADRSGELWVEHEYELLFGSFPPAGVGPTDQQVATLAAELGRTFDAIRWQWEDGASYATGRSASTTSESLKAWLDTQPGGPDR